MVAQITRLPALRAGPNDRKKSPSRPAFERTFGVAGSQGVICHEAIGTRSCC